MQLSFHAEPPGSFEELFEDWLDDEAVHILTDLAPGWDLSRLRFRLASMPLAMVGRAPGAIVGSRDDDEADWALIEALADAYRSDPDSVPPPIVRVREDGRVGWVDGSHRLDAACLAGRETLTVWVCEVVA